VEREASRLRIVALVHLPLAAAIGLDRETAERLEASERRALAAAALVVATGKSTMAELSRYGVAADRVALVEPGTDRAALSRGSIGAPLHLLSVAAITAGKGHDILIRALQSLPNRDWLLTCAGSLDRDPAAVERLRALIREGELDGRVSLPGELDAGSLEVCYNCADVFVLATLQETYGMAVAEALAHGLPVVSTITGAIPELVGAVEQEGRPAGLLAPPGDVDAMATALGKVIGDQRLRQQLAEGARQARDRLPTWDAAVDRMAAVLNDVH
jgi:glycosyltransferase involved in cell wall biosynthesis